MNFNAHFWGVLVIMLLGCVLGLGVRLFGFQFCLKFAGEGPSLAQFCLAILFGGWVGFGGWTLC